jgi:hypothetical protein
MFIKVTNSLKGYEIIPASASLNILIIDLSINYTLWVFMCFVKYHSLY